MQTAIIKAEGKGQYYFYDDPVWDEDISRDEVFGVLCTEEAVGTHECVKSCLYDDMEGFIDQIQEEYGLPDGERFIVTYFQRIPSASGLLQLVDFGITKDEIITNVEAQKYVEGARYFTMKQLKQNVMDRLSAEWIPHMKAYRLYDARHPQQTVAYEENADMAEQRATEEGYAGLVLCDANTMHAGCH